MADIEGVLKVDPDPSCVPPEAALNHVTALDEVALSVTLPVPQRLTLAAVGAEGIEFIIA